jgi:hypothetical protein
MNNERMKMKDQAWLCGVNHHSNQVTLHIGTTAELRDIAEASGGQIAEVFQDEISEDTPWKDGVGWYYATAGAISYHKADSLEECVRAILTQDGHPLVFTVEEAIGHLDLGPDEKGARLWHHNKFRVLEAIRNCLDRYGIRWEPDPVSAVTTRNYHNENETFKVGQSITHCTDEGELVEGKITEIDGKSTSLHIEFADGSEGWEKPETCYGSEDVTEHEDDTNELIAVIWPMLDAGVSKGEIRAMINNVLDSWMPKPLTILVRDDDEWGSDGAVFFSEDEKDEFLRNCGWEDDDGCFEVEVPAEAREDVVAERPHGSVQLRRILKRHGYDLEKGEIVKLEEV